MDIGEIGKKFGDFVEGIPFIGPIIGGIGDYFSGQATNEANAEQAAMNRQFQERMSSTSYQRSTKDMMAAGLNPMLAYQQGGASSPGGSMATMQNPMSGAISSALAIGRQKAEIENIKADTANKMADKPGREATSKRLAYEIDNIVPVQFQTAQFERDVRQLEALLANMEYAVLTPDGKGRVNDEFMGLVANFFRAKFQMLPAEVREKLARAALDEVEERYHPMKAIGGVAANVLSGASSVRRLFGKSGGYMRRGRGR